MDFGGERQEQSPCPAVFGVGMPRDVKL